MDGLSNDEDDKLLKLFFINITKAYFVFIDICQYVTWFLFLISTFIRAITFLVFLYKV